MSPSSLSLHWLFMTLNSLGPLWERKGWSQLATRASYQLIRLKCLIGPFIIPVIQEFSGWPLSNLPNALLEHSLSWNRLKVQGCPCHASGHSLFNFHSMEWRNLPVLGRFWVSISPKRILISHATSSSACSDLTECENYRSSASKRPPPHLPQSSQICLVLPHSICVSRTVYTVVLKITWTKQKKQTTNNGNVFHTLFIVGDPQLDRKQRTVEWVSVWMKDEWIYRSIQACEGLLGELEKSDDRFIICTLKSDRVDDHRGQVCFFSHIVFLHSKLSILHSWALCLVKK